MRNSAFVRPIELCRLWLHVREKDCGHQFQLKRVRRFGCFGVGKQKALIRLLVTGTKPAPEREFFVPVNYSLEVIIQPWQNLSNPSVHNFSLTP